MLFTAFMTGGSARTNVLGTDSNSIFNKIDQGGAYLDLKTVHDESHYAYNR